MDVQIASPTSDALWQSRGSAVVFARSGVLIALPSFRVGYAPEMIAEASRDGIAIYADPRTELYQPVSPLLAPGRRYRRSALAARLCQTARVAA